MIWGKPLPTPLGKVFESLLLETPESLSSRYLLVKSPQNIPCQCKRESGPGDHSQGQREKCGPGVRLKGLGMFLSRALVLGSRLYV